MREEIKARINRSVLYIHSHVMPITFPFDARKAVALYNNCRMMTYEELETAGSASHEDVICACESYAGCTKYDRNTGRFLILVNTSDRNTVSKERINWTIAHELGHIICKHFDELLSTDKGEIQSSEIRSAEMEEEADAFAAELLAPMPALCRVGVKNVGDIRRCFGLSQQAAEFRWAELKRYSNSDKGFGLFWETRDLSLLFKRCGISAPRSSGRFQEMIIPNAKAIDIMPDEAF